MNEGLWQDYWTVGGRAAAIMTYLRRVLASELCRYFRQRVEPSGGATRALEAGCGSAIVSEMLSARGWYCVGLDYEQTAVDVARRVAPRVRMIQGDLYQPCFRDGAFDLVWSNSTLEHLPEPVRVLREMAAVCRSRGAVFIGVPYTYGPLAVFKLKRRSFWGAWDGTTYSRKGLVDLFAAAGLEVVDHRFFFGRSFIGVMGRKS